MWSRSPTCQRRAQARPGVPIRYSPGFAFCRASRRAAASQEFAIQVPMPSRGSTHRISTMYAPITSMICSQSGTLTPSFII